MDRIYKEIYAKLQQNTLSPFYHELDSKTYRGANFSGDHLAVAIESDNNKESLLILLQPEYNTVQSIGNHKTFEWVEARLHFTEKSFGSARQLAEVAAREIRNRSHDRATIHQANQFVRMLSAWERKHLG